MSYQDFNRLTNNLLIALVLLLLLVFCCSLGLKACSYAPHTRDVQWAPFQSKGQSPVAFWKAKWKVQVGGFHSEPNLLIIVHQVNATLAQRAIDYVASICKCVWEAKHVGTRNCHLSTFLSTQFRQGSAAFMKLIKQNLILHHIHSSS